MERVFVFLIRNDTWIYILSALGLFWYFSQFIRAQRGLRSAVFGLERERGQQKRNSGLLFSAVFAVILSSVLLVNRLIAPTLPPELLKPPTPTPDALRTPLAPPTPLGTPQNERPVVTPDLAPTVTLPGQPALGDAEAEGVIEEPAVTPTVYVPPTPFVGCTADLNISDPRDGAGVSGEIIFFGTADTPNFGSYILETNGPETNGQWASLLGRAINQPVRESQLGTTNLSLWGPGPYLVRLTALDNAENITGECVIQVTLTGN
jgi:hypothetical protein